jgi:hypothetical protein
MALRKSITRTAYGQDVTIPAAYVKIITTSGSKDSQTVVAHIFTDDTKLKFVEEFRCSFAPDMNGANFIKQGYQHLKLLEEFSGAEDV